MSQRVPDQSQESLILRHELQSLWQGQDVFALVQQLEGRVVRAVPGRQTLRFELAGQGYYCKLHTGVGWGEIIKNLLYGRLPIIGARNEWLALNRLAELGVPSLEPLAYGEQGWNPARRLSFIVTRELLGTVQLDDYLRAHPRLPFAAKQQLLQTLAEMVRRIHQHGLNHRDLYLCHFLLDPLALAKPAVSTRPLLYLVDLHRAQMRDQVPRRWLVKDLASLYFSTLDLAVSRRDIARFLAIYFAQPWRQVLKQQAPLLRAIAARAQRLYAREQRLRQRQLQGRGQA